MTELSMNTIVKFIILFAAAVAVLVLIYLLKDVFSEKFVEIKNIFSNIF